jgi:hypothetical protein
VQCIQFIPPPSCLAGDFSSNDSDAYDEVSTPRRGQPARIAVIMNQFRKNYKEKITMLFACGKKMMGFMNARCAALILSFYH